MYTRSGKYFGLGDNNDQSNDNSIQVNTDYKYTEDDLKLVIPALIADEKLRLSMKSNGLLLNPDQSIYKNIYGAAVAITLPLSISEDQVGDKQRLEELDEFVRHIIKEFKKHKIYAHTILFPLNIFNSHWCLGELKIDFIADNAVVKISESAEICIYDSMSNKNFLKDLKQMLHFTLAKYVPEGTLFDLSIRHKQLRKQPDMTSCGPITAYNLIEIIKTDELNLPCAGELIFGDKEILDMRARQLMLTDNPGFLMRQIANKQDLELSAQKYNGDIDWLAQKIAQYRDSLNYEELKDFSSIAIDFIEYEELSSSENLGNSNLIVIANIKSWFNKHQDRIGLEILQNFFKVEQLPATLDEWADGGKDTLYAVLDKVFLTDEVEPESVDLVKVNKNGYKFHGFKNAEKLANTLGKENSIKFGEYIGEFSAGVKSGKGLDVYPVPGYKIQTYYFGERNVTGDFETGAIGCFLGGKVAGLEDESYIVFTGWIHGGIINDLGKLSLFVAGEKKYSLVGEFSQGVLVKPYANDFPEDVYTHCKEHFIKYSHQFKLYLDPDLEAEQNITRKRFLTENSSTPKDDVEDNSSTVSSVKSLRASP